MNNLILSNKSSLKHEEHPFHIFSLWVYFLFIMALIVGMFVATFTFLMPYLNWYSFKIFIYSNSNLLNFYLVDYLIILSQTWFNDSDAALMYLTLEHFSKNYFNGEVISITTVLSPYIFYGSFFIVCLFIVVCQWLILFSLPFITISRLSVLKWFLSMWILEIFMLLVTAVYTSYGSEMMHVKFNNINFMILVDSLNINLSFNTYAIWKSVLIMFSGRILTCSVIFSIFILITTLKNWNSLVENTKFINRWNKGMILRIENQPKFLLVSMVIGTFLLPYFFNFLETFVSGLFFTLLFTLSSAVIFFLNLFGLNEISFLFKKFIEFVPFELERAYLFVKTHPTTTFVASVTGCWGIWKVLDTGFEAVSARVAKLTMSSADNDGMLSDINKSIKPVAPGSGIQLDEVDRSKVRNVAARVIKLHNKDNPLEIDVKVGWLDIKETRK